ncbi:hypothetical protein [Erwinia sp.]|uniref:hypothetical protein n=1 Tax=Erwinia citreus TaxID=558 RepID=UPI00289C6DBA|nr:hypothetical protein [Erwinia sp.]
MHTNVFLTHRLKRLALLVFILLLASSASASRDPFSPPENVLCEPLLSAPPPQLRGIIGQPEDYRAWLVIGSGGGKLWRAQSWPNHDWRLSGVTALGITLASAGSCRPPLKINLQGSLYDTHSPVENSSPAAAMAGSTAAGQPGPAFPGVR